MNNYVFMPEVQAQIDTLIGRVRNGLNDLFGEIEELERRFNKCKDALGMLEFHPYGTERTYAAIIITMNKLADKHRKLCDMATAAIMQYNLEGILYDKCMDRELEVPVEYLADPCDCPTNIFDTWINSVTPRRIGVTLVEDNNDNEGEF